ncbi:MAG TPA: hypothetical protein PKA03_11545, partial [Tabrizicola sp.]|nr:hypothetical protein [Tabrizicola sp.]
MRCLSLSLLLLATPALAEVDVRQAVIDVASASNCVITEAIAEDSFPKLGLTQDDVGIVVEEMILADEAELVDNELHLSSDLCTGSGAMTKTDPVAPSVAPSVSPLMGRVIAVFHANGCTMTEDVGLPAFLAAGITEDDLGTLTDESDALAASGFMIRDEATLSITITEPLCSSPVVASDPADGLIRMLTENGCALTQDAASGLVGDYGLTMETA